MSPALACQRCRLPRSFSISTEPSSIPSS
jgi:hypothetical protein